MFDFLNKKPEGQSVTFKIDGMHCTSCSMNIDGELEETEGVISSSTSYPKSTTKVVYNSNKVNSKTLKKIIESLEYKATEVIENSS